MNADEKADKVFEDIFDDLINPKPVVKDEIKEHETILDASKFFSEKHKLIKFFSTPHHNTYKIIDELQLAEKIKRLGEFYEHIPYSQSFISPQSKKDLIKNDHKALSSKNAPSFILYALADNYYNICIEQNENLESANFNYKTLDFTYECCGCGREFVIEEPEIFNPDIVAHRLGGCSERCIP